MEIKSVYHIVAVTGIIREHYETISGSNQWSEWRVQYSEHTMHRTEQYTVQSRIQYAVRVHEIDEIIQNIDIRAEGESEEQDADCSKPQSPETEGNQCTEEPVSFGNVTKKTFFRHRQSSLIDQDAIGCDAVHRSVHGL